MLSDKARMDAWNRSAIEDNPFLFVTDVLGAKPEPHQVEALEAVRLHSHVAIRAAHDQGKTALMAWVGLHHFTTRYPCKVGVVANTQDQLRDVTWAEIMKWERVLPDALRMLYDVGFERITLKSDPSECFMTARTASKSNPEALQGFHSPNLLVLLEEASGLEDVVFEIGRGAMSSLNARALMIANPTRTQGYFARSFKENRGSWHTLHWPWRHNPWSSPDYPKQMAREYGEHSNVYRVRVLGEFPTSEDNAVIPLDVIEAAIAREVDMTDGRSMVWGLDIARFGDDRCALVKRRGNHVTERPRVWRQRNLMETVGIVSREYFETPEDKKPVAINADVIGVGAGAVDRLRELGLPVYGINVGESATDPDRFMRQRDELWWAGRDWFTKRDCKIPDDPDLVADLTAPTYKLLSSGKVQIESKDELKKRGLKSPDVADAFILTFAGGEFAADYRRHSHAINDHDVLADYAGMPYDDRHQQTHAL